MNKHIHFEKIKTIIIFLPHGIGDVVNATPIVYAIRKKYPHIKLIVIARSIHEIQLFGGPTRIDDYIIFDIHKKHSFYKKIKFIFSIRKQRPDLIITQHCTDPIKYPLFSILTGARYRVGEKSNFLSFLLTHYSIPNRNIHKVENHWRLLESIGINEKVNPYVHLAPGELEKLKSLLMINGLNIISETIIIIHPGSGELEKHKRWPQEKYIALIKKILEEINCFVVLVGEGQEKAICEYITHSVNNSKLISLHNKLTIKMLTALLKVAKLVVGGDSGVLHIASAVGTQTVSIFGPTPYHWTAPFKNNHVISLNLECSPCYHTMQFGCGSPICMENIEVVTVFRKLKEIQVESLLWEK